MHILVIPSEYPTKDHPLGGIFIKEQLQILKTKHTVGLIYVYLYSIKKFLNIFFFKKSSYKFFIHCFPRLPKIKFLNYFIHYQLAKNLFSIYIKRYGKPDVIHVHFSEFAGYTARRLSKKFKIPYIITEHSTDFLDGKVSRSYKKNSKSYFFYKKIFDSAKKIICVSTYLSKHIKVFFNLKKNKIITIPNTSSNKYKKTKNKKNIDFIFIGTLEKRKNPILLLDAFKLLDYEKKYKLVMIGDGPLKNECLDHIKNNSLKNVQIKSNFSRKKVMEYINRSRILVLTSKHETFGVVLIEALSYGIPVLTTNSGGVKDIINRKNGKILKFNNPENLSKKMTGMIKNLSSYKSNKIINDYKKKFSNDVILNKVTKVYNSIK